MIQRAAPCLALLACQAPTPGTIVGNPGEARLTTGDASGASYTNAFLSVESVTWTDCGGATLDVPVDGTLDLLDPVILQAPAGTWCSLTATPAGPLWAEGQGDGGGTFALELDLPALTLASAGATGLLIEDAAVVIEIGAPGWVDAAALGLVEGEVAQIAPGDARHDALVAAAADSSAVYEDDGDGVVSEAERAAGAALGGADEDDDEEDGEEEE